MLNTGFPVKTRDFRIDFVKGVCIFLVVFAHLPRIGSYVKSLEALVGWIYNFHVPIFILISGWLFSAKARGGLECIKQIGVRLVWPYFGSGVVLIVAYGIANYFGIKSTSNPVVSYGINGCFLRLILLNGVAATWFLGTLIFCQFIVVALTTACQKIGKEGAWLICLALLTCSYFLSFTMLVPGLSLSFVIFFCMGLYARSFVKELPSSPFGIIFVIIAFFMPLHRPSAGQVILVLGMLASLMWMGEQCHTLSLGRLFAYLGKKSLPVLIFHPIFNVLYSPLQRVWLRLDHTGISGMIVVAICSVASCIIADFVTHIYPVSYLFCPKRCSYTIARLGKNIVA